MAWPTPRGNGKLLGLLYTKFMDNTWKDYFKQTKSKPPHSLLIKAISFVKNKEQALDLGSGALNDSIYLLSQDFKHVTAIDKEPVAKEIVENLPSDKFSYLISSFEDYNFPKNNFDLINAQYSLPFITPSAFGNVFDRISDSLKVGGIFTGQLFGNRDEWKQNDKMNFHTKEDAEQILSNLKVIEFNEEEQDRPTVAGVMKHWHVFHFIAEK